MHRDGCSLLVAQEWASKGRMLTLRLAATAGVAEYEALDVGDNGINGTGWNGQGRRVFLPDLR